jgi:Mn-dependent DtxR family transcriptional regulator
MIFNPTDRDIIRALYGLVLGVTASKIAHKINVHPYTVRDRLDKLIKMGLVKYVRSGNRRYYKLTLKGSRINLY